MSRPLLLATLALLAGFALACRTIDAPAPRTPTPRVEATAATPTRTATPIATRVFVLVPTPVPLELEDTPGDPHSGREIVDLFGSAGLQVQTLPSSPLVALCATIETVQPVYRSYSIVVGTDTASVTIGLAIFTDVATRAENWLVDESGNATIKADGPCADRLSRLPGFITANPLLSAFFQPGFVEEGAIGRGNIVVVFKDVVFGNIQLGGDGLDPGIRAEVEQLIRGLHEE